MRTGSSSQASDPTPDRWGRAILAGALLAGLVGGVPRLLAGTRPTAAPAPLAREATKVAASIRPAPIRAARATAPAPAPSGASEAPLPGSLQGTEEDGALRVDEAGDLVIGPEVLRLFDYYLSATGEESSAAIRGRIVAAIQRRHLGARAEAQATALLDQYLDYREATRRLRADGDDPGARLSALRELRHRSFGEPVARKLFGDEERALEAAIARRRILTDGSLPAAERETRLAALEAELPPSVRAARAESTRPIRDRAEEDAMRAAGASDDDLRAVRVASYGEEAADRLAELDRQRAEWRSRLAEFRDARAQILASETDPARQQAAVQRLLDASFTPREQIRVQAADQQKVR